MAYQLSDLKTKVRNKLNDTAFSDPLLIEFANDVNRMVHNKRRLRYMEKTQNYTITSGNSSLGTLPTDMQIPISLRITSPVNYANLLTYADYEAFDENYPQPSLLGTGTPSIWTYFGTSLIVGPAVTDQSYTLQLRYLKIPTVLTADADVPDVPAEFEELMVLGMYKRALMAGDNFDQAQVVQADYDRIEALIVQRYGRRQLAQPHIMRHA